MCGRSVLETERTPPIIERRTITPIEPHLLFGPSIVTFRHMRLIAPAWHGCSPTLRSSAESGYSGKDVLNLSLTGFDPTKTA